MKFEPGKNNKVFYAGEFLFAIICFTSLCDSSCWEATGKKEGDFSSEKLRYKGVLEEAANC